MKALMTFLIGLIFSATLCAWEGNGSDSTPYLITSRADLMQLATDVNAGTPYKGRIFALARDIDLGGADSPWTPIGYWNAGLVQKPFKGTFLGNGHRISNLFIADPARDDAGLFGYLESGEISDLTLDNVKITGSRYVGTLVGYSDGTLENCTVLNSTVSGTQYVGGLCGYNLGTLRLCTSHASVSQGAHMGGLIGENFGTLNACYATGTVSGTINIGGLIGYNSGEVRNCYASGAVKGSESVGGFIGCTLEKKIRNSYAVGKVTATSTSAQAIGGFVGCNTTGTFSNCYYSTALSGCSRALGEGSGTIYTRSQTQLELETFANSLNSGQSPRIWFYVPGRYPDLFAPCYDLIVENGTGSGTHAAGTRIEINGFHADTVRYVFDSWQGDTAYIDSPFFEHTFLTMPLQGCTVRAHYKLFSGPDEMGLTVSFQNEALRLHWTQTDAKGFEIYRVTPAGARIKIGFVKGNEFTDNAASLHFNALYGYEIVAKSTKAVSARVFGEMTHENMPTLDGACGVVVALTPRDIDTPDTITAFAKPSVTGYYEDPFTAKSKKTAMVVKATSDTLLFFCKTELPLMNAKLYKQRTLFSHEILGDSTILCPELPLHLTIKKADALHKDELRIKANYRHQRLHIDTIEGMLLTDSICICAAEQDTSRVIQGRYFGLKTPKAFLEYRDKKGKIKQTALKVQPVNKERCSVWTKSIITNETGASQCRVIFPMAKFCTAHKKEKLPAYGTFVLSNGKSFDAVKFSIDWEK